MLSELIIMVTGVAAILILAELIIFHAIKVADYTGLSGTFIGMTILSIGTAIMLYIFLLRKEDLNRGEAVTLLICYFSYVFFRWFLFPLDTLLTR